MKKFYIFDKETLEPRLVNLKIYIGAIVIAILIITSSSYLIGHNSGIDSINRAELDPVEHEILIRKACEDTFNIERFVIMLNETQVNFPYIVMAQSLLETNEFRSDIFLENNNLFGMREAKSRPTTAVGTNRSHAYYNHWRESVYDYVFYQCSYLRKIKTEDEYFQYLGSNYAEADEYVQAVKRIIKKEKLRDLFKK